MAQQAFLAQQRRDWALESSPEKPKGLVRSGTTFLRRGQKRGRSTMIKALYESKDRIEHLFELWDEDGNGTLSVIEFRRAMRMLGQKPSTNEIKQFFELFDKDDSHTFELVEMMAIVEEEGRRLAEEEAAARAAPPPEPQSHTRLQKAVRLLQRSYSIAASDTVQVVLYLVFCVLMQNLIFSMRNVEEYYLDKQFNDMVLRNPFDRDLNRFQNVRRPADIYQFGSQVLWPALLGNGGPSCEGIGESGLFHSFDPSEPSATSNYSGLCNDDTLPDGGGYMNREGATPPTVAEVAERMNQMDWSDGVRLLQIRVAPTSEAACATETIGGLCYPEIGMPGFVYGRADFGYNWTARGEAPLLRPLRWQSAAQMGATPTITSASQASFRAYEGDGFASFVVPFFSSIFLPEERGLARDVRHLPRAPSRTFSRRPLI